MTNIICKNCQENQRNLTGPGRERRKQVMDAFDIAFDKASKSKMMEVAANSLSTSH